MNESEQGIECIEQDDNDDIVDDTRKSGEESVPRKKKVEFVKDPSKRRKIDYRTSNSLLCDQDMCILQPIGLYTVVYCT